MVSAPRLGDPLGLLGRLLTLPVAYVPLNLAQDSSVLAPVEVLEDRVRVVVVVERLAQESADSITRGM